MDDTLLKKTAILSSVFSVAALGLMTAFFFLREVPVNAQGLVYDSETVMGENADMLNMGGQTQATDYLCIPLPEETTEDKVSIVMDEMTHTMSLSVSGVTEEFYYHHAFTGCSDHITKLMYGYGNDTARIDLILDSVYEYESVFENGNLYLRFLAPKEVYHKIVVLDAGHGGESTGTTSYGQTESDIALSVTMRAKELLEQNDIHVYCTRQTSEAEPSEAERLLLAAETKADMMVCIHANADAKTRVTNGVQTLYSDEVFIPGFDSHNLAEDIVSEMAAATGAKNAGSVSENNLAVLKKSGIPTVYAEVGYLTNRKEALNLGDEAYQDMLAQGICNGILKSYREMGQDK